MNIHTKELQTSCQTNDAGNIGSQKQVFDIMNWRHTPIQECSFNTELPCFTHYNSGQKSCTKDYFFETGYSSLIQNARVTGYALVTTDFLAYFQARNQGMPGFQNFRFSPEKGNNVGEALKNDGTKTQLFIIGKSGEGVLSGEQMKVFFEDQE